MPRGSQKLKFSYKEQREFETIEGDIAALEEKIAALQAQQAAQASDYVALGRLQAEEARAQGELEEKMERWVYLTDLNERIEAQKEE